MKELEIELLNKQVAKLNADDFDLEAWKGGAIILLERIFGPDNQKIKQLEKIKYDQSSWALREAKGSNIAMDELNQFGLPEEIADAQAAPFKTVIVEALENELKISQYRAVVRIIDSDKKLVEKQKELIDTLHQYGHDVAENILTNILLSEQTKKYL